MQFLFTNGQFSGLIKPGYTSFKTFDSLSQQSGSGSVSQSKSKQNHGRFRQIVTSKDLFLINAIFSFADQKPQRLSNSKI